MGALEIRQCVVNQQSRNIDNRLVVLGIGGADLDQRVPDQGGGRSALVARELLAVKSVSAVVSGEDVLTVRVRGVTDEVRDEL